MLRINPFTCSFMTNSLSDTLFTFKILSTSSSLTTIPTHFFFHQLRCKIVCSHLQCSFALHLFHFVSCRHSMSTFFRSIMSASSLPFPVIVPIFKVPIFMSVGLPFHSFRCLFTRLPLLFLLLFSLSPAIV